MSWLVELRDWLGGLLPASIWRVILASLSGLAVFSASTGGLFIPLPWAQPALLAGIAIGLVAPGLLTPLLIGSVVGLAGSVLGPANATIAELDPSSVPLAHSPLLIGAIAVCAAIALLTSLARRQWRGASAFLLALAVIIIVGNLWYTALSLNTEPTLGTGRVTLPSFNEQLKGNIPAAFADGDGALFFRVYEGMRDGGDFYQEYDRQLRELRGPAGSVFDYRIPLLFWFWAALPGPRFVVIAYLVLSTAAILSVVAVGLPTVRAPLTLVGVAGLASYVLFFPLTFSLFRQEPWSALLGVLALAAFTASMRGKRWRAWMFLAVSFAVLAILAREIMVFMAFAGLASSLTGDKRQRRFRAAAWLIGIGLLAVLFAFHMQAAQPYIVKVAGIPRAGLGGVRFMLAAFNYATYFMGSGGWMPIGLAALGFVGILSVRDARLRVFILVAVLTTLASFLVLGNNAHYTNSEGVRVYVNYWGAAAVPLLYAIAPAGFALLPGAESRRSVPTSGNG